MERRYNFERNCNLCQKTYLAHAARSKYCTNCGGNASNKYDGSFKRLEFRLKKLIGAAKFRANKANVPFEITFEDVKEIWDNQKGLCIVSGRVIDLSPWGEKGQVNPDGPSIDRIIPKLGYVKSNIRIVAYHVNIAISEYGLETFLELCSDVLKTNRI